MSGTIHSRIEIYNNTGDRLQNGASVFKSLYDFLSLAGNNFTLVALYYGDGTTGGVGAPAYSATYPTLWRNPPGAGYPDQANPFKHGAFFVFKCNATGSRAYDWYMLAQLACYNGVFLASALPALADGSNPTGPLALIAFQFAIGVGGDGNPWAGRAVKDGADYKGTGAGNTAIWRIPTGGGGGTAVHVWPRSNNPSGNPNTGVRTTLKDQHVVAVGPGSSDLPIRAHFWIDDDSIMLLANYLDDGVEHNGILFGPLQTTRTGFTWAAGTGPSARTTARRSRPW